MGDQSLNLTSEQLGEEGEGLFASLCNRAGLTANKSTKDAFGWDFVVERMDEGDPAVPLDRRSKSTARVQVKCSAARGSAVLSLSAAERLAKDPNPSLVVFFRMKDDGTPVRGHLIHIIGRNLARVLKRLRTAHTLKKRDLNKQSISFDPARDGTVFEVSPQGLKLAFDKAWGSDPSAYAHHKLMEQAGLGYEEGIIAAEAFVRFESEEQISRVLMGIEPLRPESYKAYDVRFGIALPNPTSDLFDNADIYLSPRRIDTCRLTVRGKGMITPAIFDTEVSFPWIEAGLGISTMLIKHPDFHLRMTNQAEIDFETTDIFLKERSLDEWIGLINLLTALRDPARIVLKFGRMGTFDFPLAGSFSFTGPYDADLPRILEFLRGWRTLTDLVGIEQSQPFHFDRIWDGHSAALAVEMNKPVSMAKLEWSHGAFDRHEAPSECLVYLQFSFVGQDLFLAAKALIERDGDQLISSRFSILDLRGAGADIEAYAEDIGQEHGLDLRVDIGDLVRQPPTLPS